MQVRKLATIGIIFLGTGAIATLTLLFMKIGIIWEFNLFEVPMILGMSAFLIASITYEDTMMDLFNYLEIQRFGAFVALVLSIFMLTMKILQNSF